MLKFPMKEKRKTKQKEGKEWKGERKGRRKKEGEKGNAREWGGILGQRDEAA